MKNRITLYLVSILFLTSISNIHAKDTKDNRKAIYIPQKTNPKTISSYNDTSTVYKYVTVDKNAKLLTLTEGQKLPKYIMSKIKLNSTDTPQGNVLKFSYIIDQEGNVKDIKFLNHVTSSIEQQVSQLISELKYDPAIKDCNEVAMLMKGSLYFSFFKRPAKSKLMEGGEWMPEFIGGESQMYKYIREYLKYPKTTEEGQSVIRFTITEKGKIKDVYVLKSSGSKLLDDAARKVVSRMPDWEPGLKDGKPVSVFFTLPINFKRP